MSSWKESNKEIINEMFEESLKGYAFTQVICHKCGNSTPGTCECARKRFYDELTKEEFDSYLCEKDNWVEIYADVIERMWQENKELFSTFKEYTKDNFVKSLTRTQVKRFIDRKIQVHAELEKESSFCDFVRYVCCCKKKKE
jgi:hypothetical protein